MDELKIVSESFEDALLERKKAKKKPTKKQQAKVAKTMHHWKEGKQHIGKSEKFVPVTKKGQKQAVAIALSQAGLSKKKVNEEVTTTEMVGDAQYAKDIQMITVKYNRDLQTLNDNFAKLKAQAMTNLTARQQQAQQKAAVATPQQTTNTQQQQQSQTESLNLLQFVDDDKLDEEHESSILIPKETGDYYDESVDDELGAEPIENEDEVTRDTLKNDDKWEEENLVFYVLLDDKGEDIVAKIYREDEESDWIVDVEEGSNEILDNMAFYQDYDKVQIISYLSEIFDGVEELTEMEYNEFIEEQ